MPSVEVNCVQGAPGRRHGGVAIRVQELAIAGELVACAAIAAGLHFCALIPAGVQIVGQRGHGVALQGGKGRHPAAPRMHNVCNRRGHHALADIQQRRKGRRRSGAIGAVADRAILLIGGGAQRGGCLGLDQAAGPGHVIGVDIDHAGFRIGRGPAPFRAAVKAGHHHGLLARAHGRERPVAAEGLELLQGPVMRRRRAVGQAAFVQMLAGIGRRYLYDRLGL